MILIWIIAICLVANVFFTNLLINLPFQLLQWFSMGLNVVLMVGAIAGISWFIGDD
ncbi:MAG: hypothetical protein RLZZ490_1311 [Cyanobacteriota bacterium]